VKEKKGKSVNCGKGKKGERKAGGMGYVNRNKEGMRR